MSTPQNIVKRVKRDLLRQAKDEEKAIKDATKDLSRTEKAERKAYKEVVRADTNLEQVETRKQDGFNCDALAEVQEAQNDYAFSSQKYVQIHHVKEELAANVEAALQMNEEHTRERNVKLNALRGPAAPQVASRVIPATEDQAL